MAVTGAPGRQKCRGIGVKGKVSEACRGYAPSSSMLTLELEAFNSTFKTWLFSSRRPECIQELGPGRTSFPIRPLLADASNMLPEVEGFDVVLDLQATHVPKDTSHRDFSKILKIMLVTHRPFP